MFSPLPWALNPMDTISSWGGRIDTSGYWWPPIYPTGSSCQFLVQHVLMYLFVIVGSTLSQLFEVLHIFQVHTGGLPPNPTGLFCIFSCQHILLYFQGHFGALNGVILACHSQIVVESEFDNIMCSSLKYLSNRLSRAWNGDRMKMLWLWEFNALNYPNGAHMNFGVSSPRFRFLDVEAFGIPV